ncbi:MULTISPECIES: DUF3280 domain-containing protein [unclassified Methylocaldum]|uniref:DUF3280 domain-containing protein n=2 Tax=unclassified Methylocaldum TaxID=2622260 RepID=UPI00117FA751|nr:MULTISPECIES: DUF3280 domain-containing protein [unclassified Methylocaldum]MBP1148292.1 hypothetical protein [Methylocaldum sp. RMAD-M]MDV3243510.1 DUF3280 domain-containing protein [Methylocaldum sp.]
MTKRQLLCCNLSRSLGEELAVTQAAYPVRRLDFNEAIPMHRSPFVRLISIFAVLVLVHSPVWSQNSPPAERASTGESPDLKTLAVLDLELTGDLGDSTREAEWGRRLAVMTEVLRDDLSRSGLYRVVDHGPAPELVAELKSARYLHACNGCELDIARRLGAERVLVGWVFRMSNLVLSLHIQIRDVATGQTLINRAFDFRGDKDESWRRAIAYFVQDLRERPPRRQ